MEERNAIPESLIPQSISYRQLAGLMQQAPSEPEPAPSPSEGASLERQAFETLLAEWSRSGHQLLAALGRAGAVVGEGRSQRQMMALGALQAHLAMALQAHAAATGPQQD
ncbi:MAG: hypothetical protein ER33_02285 [Cyanobium sp. CACIAM 14]|nr:MAG: hypothetical protein ER33_02285 [Cyanobium sp. CACIAM 14]